MVKSQIIRYLPSSLNNAFVQYQICKIFVEYRIQHFSFKIFLKLLWSKMFTPSLNGSHFNVVQTIACATLTPTCRADYCMLHWLRHVVLTIECATLTPTCRADYCMWYTDADMPSWLSHVLHWLRHVVLTIACATLILTCIAVRSFICVLVIVYSQNESLKVVVGTQILKCIWTRA